MSLGSAEQPPAVQAVKTLNHPNHSAAFEQHQHLDLHGQTYQL
jgi:hypothetical protein